MIQEQIIENKHRELRQLNRFREHISVLKINVGLPDEFINEMLSKINLKINRCEIIIRENEEIIMFNYQSRA